MPKSSDVVQAFALLGIRPEDPLDIVTKRYRRLALSNHPDRVGETSLIRMQEINAAYDIVKGYFASQPAATAKTSEEATDAEPNFRPATKHDPKPAYQPKRPIYTRPELWEMPQEFGHKKAPLPKFPPKTTTEIPTSYSEPIKPQTIREKFENHPKVKHYLEILKFCIIPIVVIIRCLEWLWIWMKDHYILTVIISMMLGIEPLIKLSLVFAVLRLFHGPPFNVRWW